MLERLTAALSHATDHGAEDEEHVAALEAMLLVVYADRTVRQAELEAIEALDDSHPEWVNDTFSVGQFLGPATAAVRAAIDGGDDGEALIRSIDERITTTALRAELADLCAGIAEVDGEVSPAEAQLIERLRARFDV
jgi:uncharacterized tellurite resistance protein B-like protein